MCWPNVSWRNVSLPKAVKTSSLCWCHLWLSLSYGRIFCQYYQAFINIIICDNCINCSTCSGIVFVLIHPRWSREAAAYNVAWSLAGGIAEKFTNVYKPLSVYSFVTAASVARLALSALCNSTNIELIVLVLYHPRWSIQPLFVSVTCGLASGITEKFTNVNEPF